ncbi:MAG: methyl-accepting chemotaxis protein, partial [Rhodospirillaceae bacterium]|nr:methyl-accepting chemotaxis protein [Rhodospirillaceae bacterium]
VAAAAEQAAVNVQTVASASEELTASINEISQQVSGASHMAMDASGIAEKVAEQVTELKVAGDQIENVVGLITDIASQTNLLALNATIEAARAGEAGKGFAVVANEVKNLASQTAKATDEIRGYVASIQTATENTVSGISEVATKVDEIEQANSAVSAAVEEQSAATGEIARNIEEASAGTTEVTTNIVGVNTASQETGAAATQLNGAAMELSSQSETLRTVVSDFLGSVRKVV